MSLKHDLHMLRIVATYCNAVASSVSLIVLFGLTLVSVNAQEENKIIDSREGLKLTVSVKSVAAKEETLVVCELINSNAKAVRFDNRGSLGFSFRLADASGKTIPVAAAWEALHSLSDAGKHSGLTIEPGGVISYTLPLEQAFGRGLPSSIFLKVEWSPGNDGNGNPLLLGRGLNATISIARKE